MAKRPKKFYYYSYAILGIFSSVALRVLAIYGDVPTTQPTTQAATPPAMSSPAASELDKVKVAFRADAKKWSELTRDPTQFRDSASRAQLLAKLSPVWADIVPLGIRMRQLNEQQHPTTQPATQPTTQPSYAVSPEVAKDSMWSVPQMQLIAVGHQEVTDHAKAWAASADRDLAETGQLQLLGGEWLAAPDEAAAIKTAAKIGTLLQSANEKNITLLYSVILPILNLPAVTPAASEKLAREAKANYPGDFLKKYFALVEKRNKNKVILAAVGNKPLALAGTTVEGKTFSTEQWRGKVILVDFWATWCGPCKAELPHVKAVYQKYHDQGLEVLGISNDSSKEDLVKYLASDPGLVWPNLFEANQKWSPLATKYGIDAIPEMMLIDRKGICRTINARENMDTMIPKLLAENVAAAN